MKNKILNAKILICVIIVACLFSACGKRNNANDPTPENVPSSTTTKEVEYSGLSFSISDDYQPFEDNEVYLRFNKGDDYFEIDVFDYDETLNYEHMKELEKKTFNGIEGYWEITQPNAWIGDMDKIFRFTFYAGSKEYHVRASNEEDMVNILNTMKTNEETWLIEDNQ